MASAVNPITSSAASHSTGASSTNSSSSLGTPSESVFLNLLVSQIKNQDPLNPTDSTQFVSQLAQFSELEQVIAIRTDADKLATANSTTSTTPTTTPTTSGSSTSPVSGN